MMAEAKTYLGTTVTHWGRIQNVWGFFFIVVLLTELKTNSSHLLKMVWQQCVATAATGAMYKDKCNDSSDSNDTSDSSDSSA